MSFDKRWIVVTCGLAITVVIAVVALRARDQATEAIAPGQPSASPASSPSPSRNLPVAGGDTLAIARVVAAQQALQRADASLRTANFALSEPDIPPRKPVWSTVADDESVQPPMQLNPAIENAQVVRLPTPEMLEKTPGDRITIPMPGGESLAVTVEDANRLPNGDYSWRGYVDGEGDDFPVVFTVGKNSAFATITSWEGSYTMESVGGVGWLYKNIIDGGEDSIPGPAGDAVSRYS